MAAGLVTLCASPANAWGRRAHRAATADAPPTLQAAPTTAQSGQAVVLSGTAAPATAVTLYASPYPYRANPPAQSTVSAVDGSFSFTVTPDRNTEYQVAATAGRSAVVRVGVSGRVRIFAGAIPLGRARVRVLVYHPRDLAWSAGRVSWRYGHGRRGALRPAPGTRARALSPYVTELTSTATQPAGRFRWEACLHAPAAGALLDPGNPHGCTGRGYHGTGSLPQGFPGSAAVGRASGFLHRRAGRTAFAVMDSEGRLSGLHVHWRFVSASVVKAMLLVAYLRRLHDHGQHRVDSYSNSFLYPMIHVSDNSAATQTWSIVGDSGLYSVAHAAGMTDFSIVGIWANAQISAADQARFFFEMDSLIPHEFVGYARFLLSTIAGYESWGIPAVARPRGYRVFFKGGWRGTGLGQLVHQVGRLEGHHRRFSIAVMTDGDPSMGYGIGTIQGVTGALL